MMDKIFLQMFFAEAKWIALRLAVAGIIFFIIYLLIGCGATSDNPLRGVTNEGDQVVADSATTDATDAKPDYGNTMEMPSEDVDSAITPGEFGAPCAQNAECFSGFCIQNEDGKICTKICVSDCPEGYACDQIMGTGGDPVYLCFSRFTRLCNPCAQHADCNSGGTLNKCLDRGPEGNFCGVACASDADCPSGYECRQFSADEEPPILQCTPKKNALCACNNHAKELQSSTVCYNAASPSTCKGTRMCTAADGLTPCNIPTKPEVCNGLDDNCNGETDEGLCDDGNPCTSDACNTDGSCKHTQLDGSPCDDGNACTTVDKCAAGKCVGGALKLCDDDNACTDDKCDPAGGCLFTSNKDPCDDGNQCTTADKCSEKKCVGGPPPNCNDGNPCTSDFCDTEKGCVHKADTKNDGVQCSNDLNACTVDKCVGGQCKHIPIPGCF